MSAHRPGITVIIPTQGRATLERCLRSVAAGGLTGADEVIVAIDSADMPPAEVGVITDRVLAVIPTALVLNVDDGGHSWGHGQLNAALDAAAPGNYITGNDDDDVYAPGAFDAYRAAIQSDEAAGGPRLHIFRFMPPWRSPLPEGREFAEGRIGGHCLFAANLPGKVGRFGAHYQGDWTYIEDTAARWGGPQAAVWHDEIIAICRPEGED